VTGNAEANVEAGSATLWDNAWREGHAHGLMNALGIAYKDAYMRTMLMLSGKPLDTTSDIAAAEQERIRQLAIKHQAQYQTLTEVPGIGGQERSFRPFADLIAGDSP